MLFGARVGPAPGLPRRSALDGGVLVRAGGCRRLPAPRRVGRHTKSRGPIGRRKGDQSSGCEA
jgi:hypothetical protein